MKLSGKTELFYTIFQFLKLLTIEDCKQMITQIFI